MLLLCLCAPALAQAPPSNLLLDGGQCLVDPPPAGLGLAHAPAALELGSVTDDRAYRGADLLYLVDYSTPTHAQGTVYVFLVNGKSPHRILHLQYSVGFRQTDDGSGQVSLDDPPLGGMSTRDDIVATIHQIGFRTYTIPVATLARHSSAIHCESDPPSP